jgi:hypothetical protein
MPSGPVALEGDKLDNNDSSLHTSNSDTIIELKFDDDCEGEIKGKEELVSEVKTDAK